MDGEIIVYIHRRGNFVKGRKLKCKGTTVIALYLVDADKFPFFKLGYAKDFGYEGLVDFFYVTPGSTMESGLRRVHTNDDFRDMIRCIRGQQEVNAYILYAVDEPRTLEAFPSVNMFVKAILMNQIPNLPSQNLHLQKLTRLKERPMDQQKRGGNNLIFDH